MEPIPYFDAHCDTIYRCLRTGEQYRDTDPELYAFYQTGHALRENAGHIDLRRAAAFGQFAQVFALYQDPAEVPPGSTMVREGRLLHQKFLREMEENRDVIVHCRTGRDVDRAVKDGKMAALLSIEGADLMDCDPDQVETAAAWGVRFLNPVWNWPNVLSGTNCRDTDRGLSPRAPTSCGGWRSAVSTQTCPTSATRGSGTWCVWPGGRWRPPTPTAGPCVPTGATSPMTCSGPSGTAAAWWG